MNKEDIEKYRKLPTGNVADNNTIHGTMDAAIKPVDPECHMLGQAVTVQGHPGDNLALYQGIATAHEGDVLVVDVRGFTRAGHFGDMMATACLAKGIAGVVIDGTCRDVEDLRASGLPVFARGYCPEGTTKACLGSLNVPITVGGVCVHPGDWILGDCDGVVVIPEADAELVLEKGHKKHLHEEEIRQRLLRGEDILSVYGFDKIVGQLRSR